MSWIDRSLSTVDIFAAGAGFELAGGYLLAMAAMAPSRVLAAVLINRRTRETLDPLPPGIPSDEDVEVKERADEGVRARMGVCGLLLGFGAQLVGYVLTTAHGSSAPTFQRGLFALVPCLVIAVVAGLLTRPVVRWGSKRTVVSVALRVASEDEQEASAKLASCAPLYGSRDEAESTEVFTRRTFPSTKSWGWPHPGAYPHTDPPGAPDPRLADFLQWLNDRAAQRVDPRQHGGEIERLTYLKLVFEIQRDQVKTLDQAHSYADAAFVLISGRLSRPVPLWSDEGEKRAWAAIRQEAQQRLSGVRPS